MNFQSANNMENISVNKAKPLLTGKGALQPTVTTKRAALGNISMNIRVQPNASAMAKTKPCIVNEAEKVIKPALRPITRRYLFIKSIILF